MTIPRPGMSRPGRVWGSSKFVPWWCRRRSWKLLPTDLCDPGAIVASDMVMGNGIENDVQDIVFVRPENFSPMQTPAIAQQIEPINRQLRSSTGHSC